MNAPYPPSHDPFDFTPTVPNPLPKPTRHQPTSYQPTPYYPTVEQPVAERNPAEPADVREPRSKRPATSRRGRRLSLLSMVLAFVMATVLGIGSYALLASINIASVDPFGASMGWLTLIAFSCLGALAAFALAIIALAFSRAKVTAGIALILSVALPVITVAAGATIGFAQAKQNVVANGAAAAGLVGDAVDAWGVDLPTPLRELLETVGSAKG